MLVRINRKPYDVPASVSTIEEFSVRMRLKPQNTLLKLNQRHVPWDRWSSSLADTGIGELDDNLKGGIIKKAELNITYQIPS
jgi:hypothetical protein